jgi:hypothetical protein
MTDEDEKIILDLYFEQMYTYDMILNHFKKKYVYKEIKQVINKKFEAAGNNIYFERRKTWLR